MMKTTTKFILYLASVMFVLSLSSALFAQDLKDLKGVQLYDGTVIHGKVIESNIHQVIIEKKDGNRVSVKFEDVSNFIKEEQTEEVTKELKKEKNLVNFIVDIKPLSVLVSPNINGFSVTKTTPGIIYTESISGVGSWLPQLKLGVGFNLPLLFIDLYGGVGYLYNEAFSASMYLGDVAFRFKLGEHMTLGPHIGVVSLKSRSGKTGQ
jgi:hypothetical protein